MILSYAITHKNLHIKKDIPLIEHRYNIAFCHFISCHFNIEENMSSFFETAFKEEVLYCIESKEKKRIESISEALIKATLELN